MFLGIKALSVHFGTSCALSEIFIILFLFPSQLLSNVRAKDHEAVLEIKAFKSIRVCASSHFLNKTEEGHD